MASHEINGSTIAAMQGRTLSWTGVTRSGGLGEEHLSSLPSQWQVLHQVEAVRTGAVGPEKFCCVPRVVASNA